MKVKIDFSFFFRAQGEMVIEWALFDQAQLSEMRKCEILKEIQTF